MKWQISRFRKGEQVQVREWKEILKTLDENGCLEGMPFMPEMLQYCGTILEVEMVAHKTCEVAQQTLKARRLDRTVHLSDSRCDGSGHGGCEAECNLYWKDEWLKRPDHAPSGAGSVTKEACDYSEILNRASECPTPDGDTKVRYSCQATRLFEASDSLAWWDPRQYVRDIVSGNHSVSSVLSVLAHSFLEHLVKLSPFGFRILKRIRDKAHRKLFGRDVPDFIGQIDPGAPTPGGRLNLKPGEWVRIKSKEEIASSLDRLRKNRGMYFDREMVIYCGREARVKSSVTRLIDEKSGEMLSMKQPCIILEGLVCRGEYSECRLLCPRQIYPFWREIWLERVEARDQTSFGSSA